MIRLFPNSSARCIKCNTPLNGVNIKFIGDYAYCSDDYEKELEKPDTRTKQKEMNWFTKHFNILR